MSITVYRTSLASRKELSLTWSKESTLNQPFRDGAWPRDVTNFHRKRCDLWWCFFHNPWFLSFFHMIPSYFSWFLRLNSPHFFSNVVSSCSISHDGSFFGAAIYAVPWIPSIYSSHVSINIPYIHGSVMGYGKTLFLMAKSTISMAMFYHHHG